MENCGDFCKLSLTSYEERKKDQWRIQDLNEGGARMRIHRALLMDRYRVSGSGSRCKLGRVACEV